MNISPEQCKYLINLSESKKGWKRIRFGSKTSYRTVMFGLDNEEIKYLIIKYCNDYLNITIDNVNVGIIKYETGDLFQRHIDNGGSTHRNLFSKDFIYNINVILNDDYEGGEFYLNDKPYPKPPGEIYHYKSNEYHEVKKITNGIRYSALFYIRYQDIIEFQKLKKII
jgi:hypothetical protein